MKNLGRADAGSNWGRGPGRGWAKAGLAPEAGPRPSPDHKPACSATLQVCHRSGTLQSISDSRKHHISERLKFVVVIYFVSYSSYSKLSNAVQKSKVRMRFPCRPDFGNPTYMKDSFGFGPFIWVWTIFDHCFQSNDFPPEYKYHVVWVKIFSREMGGFPQFINPY